MSEAKAVKKLMAAVTVPLVIVTMVMEADMVDSTAKMTVVTAIMPFAMVTEIFDGSHDSLFNICHSSDDSNKGRRSDNNDDHSLISIR